jgi:hypothetical protein
VICNFFKSYGSPFVIYGINKKTIKSLIKKTIMKNSFKLGLLALAIATSFAACKGNSSASGADSAKMDSAKMDSAKMDTASKMGAATDSAKTDTAKKDTTKK